MKRCPYCTEKYKEESEMIIHLQEEHEEMIPKGFDSEQLAYFIRTGKTSGRCLVCKRDTKWNPATGKYTRLCTRDTCREQYAETFRKNMMGKYGKTTLLNDPNHQKKMLANRSISGEYEWSDGRKIGYTGTYELDFLKFLDQFMGFESSDVMSPSPHTYYYMYEGKKLFYIPDFFITSLNLEVEIKAGGRNENQHHKIQAVDRVKEKLKDEVLRSQKEYSYIKVYDKEYDNFLDLLLAMKGTDKPVYYTKDYNAVNESMEDIVRETYHMLGSEDTDVMDRHIEFITSLENFDYQNELLIQLENHSNYYKTSSEVLNQVSLFDKENPGIVDKYDFGSQNKFGIYHPGFIDKDTESTMLHYLKTKNKAVFRDDIIHKALDGSICKENFIRDLKVAQYVISETVNKEPENRHELIESYCWIDTIVNESAVTIGKEKRYPVYVLLTHTGTLLSNTIKGFTGKEYSHCSISLDPSLDKMYSFGRKYKSNPLIGTFVRENITDGLFEDVAEKGTYALYVTFVTEEEYKRIQKRLEFFEEHGSSFKYNFKGLLSHALGKESARTGAFFCSQFVDTIMSAAKPYFDRHSSLVKPTDYMEHDEFTYVSKGLLKDYNPVSALKKTELIASNMRNFKINPTGKVLYFPLNRYEEHNGYIELSQDAHFIPLTYKQLLETVKTSSEVIKHYTIIPMRNLPGIVLNISDDLAIIEGPVKIKYTNKNLI